MENCGYCHGSLEICGNQTYMAIFRDSDDVFKISGYFYAYLDICGDCHANLQISNDVHSNLTKGRCCQFYCKYSAAA